MPVTRLSNQLKIRRERYKQQTGTHDLGDVTHEQASETNHRAGRPLRFIDASVIQSSAIIRSHRSHDADKTNTMYFYFRERD